jgi:methyltransferase-like protein
MQRTMVTIKPFFHNHAYALQSNKNSYQVHEMKFVNNLYIKIRHIKCYKKCPLEYYFFKILQYLMCSYHVAIEWIKVIF